MIFDSEAQKQRIIDMIGEVPVTTDVSGLLRGPSPEVMRLMQSLVSGHVMSIEDQTAMLIRLDEMKRGNLPDD